MDDKERVLLELQITTLQVALDQLEYRSARCRPTETLGLIVAKNELKDSIQLLQGERNKLMDEYEK